MENISNIKTVLEPKIDFTNSAQNSQQNSQLVEEPRVAQIYDLLNEAQQLISEVQNSQDPVVKDIGFASLKILLLLQRSTAAMTMSDLATKAFRSHGTLTAQVKKLVDLNLVERSRAAHDDRIVLVNLTSKGKNVVAQYQEDIVKVLTVKVGANGNEATQSFVHALQAVIQYLSK